MALGLSTYAFSWRRTPPEDSEVPGAHSDVNTAQTLADLFDVATTLSCDVFQVCDVPELDNADATEVAAIAAAAHERSLTLELGTRGLEPDHLLRYLDLARTLDCRLVRSMMSSTRGCPTVTDATAKLREVIPAYAAAGVTLGLETYEQYSTDELVSVVRSIDDEHLGIVLDPGNCVARLERPADVVEKTAPHVVNLHVKDFAFTRAERTLGFMFAGAPLGEGLLEYDAMCDVLDRHGRKVNHVIEHWLPWQGSYTETCRVEQRWVDAAAGYLQQRHRY